MDFIETIEKELGQKAIKNFLQMQSGDVKDTLADTSFLENWIEYRPLTTVEDGINNLFIGISLFIRNFNFQIFSILVLIPLPKLTPYLDLFCLD